MKTLTLGHLFSGTDAPTPSSKAISATISYLMSEGFGGTIEPKPKDNCVLLNWHVPEVSALSFRAEQFSRYFPKIDRRYLVWEGYDGIVVRRPILSLSEALPTLKIRYTEQNSSVTRAFQVPTSPGEAITMSNLTKTKLYKKPEFNNEQALVPVKSRETRTTTVMNIPTIKDK